MHHLLAALVVFGAAASSQAQQIDFNGFADLRLVKPSDQKSGFNGGLGKLQFDGGRKPGVDFQVDQVLADVKIQALPDLNFFGTFRYMRDQKTALDILESYARYRPAPTDAVRWSVKAGAFFPPVSLENEGIGWTSPWTITSSAINSWVGEELRTLGAEATVEWKFDGGALEAVGSVFGWNDPTGVLIAYRGWGLNDRPVGLLDHTRLPDAIGIQFHQPLPQRTSEFMEIDNQPGWYAGLTLRETELGRLSILRYENRADPALDRNNIYAWRTEFTSVGLETYIGDLVLLAQGMAGLTEIVPFAGFHSVTEFQSAYVLLGWDIGGDWRLAARAETFGTRNRHPGTGLQLSEHGNAGTLAVTWKPLRWLRLTGEVLRVNSVREQRALVHLNPHQIETQLQLSARLFF